MADGIKRYLKAVFTGLLICGYSITCCGEGHVNDRPGRLNERLDKCTKIVNEMMQMPDAGIPKSLLAKCTAIAIFPETLKGGFIWGGRFGQGVILAKDKSTGTWSAPAFFSLGEISFGLQVGGQAIDLVLVLFGQDALVTLVKENLTLGTDASLTAGPIGRTAEVNTDILLKGGVLSYSKSQGLFAGVSAKGGAITPNNFANMSFYGVDLTPRDILLGSMENIPAPARKLIDTLNGYTAKKVVKTKGSI